MKGKHQAGKYVGLKFLIDFVDDFDFVFPILHQAERSH